jgi:histidine triad (HIT) family protein
MDNCEICEEIKKRELILFEDQDIIAFFSETPSALSHIIVTTKKHFPSIKEVPDHLVAWAFAIANKLSKILLEGVNLQGLNLLVNIGKEQMYNHFCLHILPRIENDNLNLKWTPKKGDPDELKTVQLLYQQEINTEKPKEPEIEKPKSVNNKEDYRIKQLHRLP